MHGDTVIPHGNVTGLPFPSHLNLRTVHVIGRPCLQAPIALVSSLRETSVIFAMFLGAFLLKETISRAKIMITLVMVAGIIISRLY